MSKTVLSIMISCIAGILGIFFTVGKKGFTKKKTPYIIVSLKNALE
jgi:hypothetical protein